ncbi:cell division protein ZapA [Sneathiella glossodoripedis]|uniref:cell division protein ZapA n=1 Tax=Sneathiella glossodoripedis TaxID=418853 RepID=UPI00047012D1|nr:cell division protein ZapA [Sneathiella glossodoripedis]
MASVTVKINGRPYPIICDDGEEDHLLYLSEYVDKKVKELSGMAGSANEAQLLLMASLLIADDLSQAYETIDELREGKDGAKDAPGGLSIDGENLAKQLEAIADRLEKA